MNEHATAWAALQTAALADLHPRWCPMLDPMPDPMLFEPARRSRGGRRELAQRLARRGLALFTRPAAQPQELAILQHRRWLVQPLALLGDLPLWLGALRLAPALRAAVGRDEVLRLRRVLGDARYERLLHDPAAGAQAECATPLAEDDAALDVQLRAAGACELCAQFAAQPAIAERLRLAFDPEWTAAAAPQLDTAAFDAQLAAWAA